MAMITMQGKIINCFQANQRKEYIDGVHTGKMLEGSYKIQVMGDSVLESGEKRAVLQDMTCHDIQAFKQFMGKEIRFEIGVMAQGDKATLFIPKGTKPELVTRP